MGRNAAPRHTELIAKPVDDKKWRVLLAAVCEILYEESCQFNSSTSPTELRTSEADPASREVGSNE